MYYVVSVYDCQNGTRVFVKVFKKRVRERKRERKSKEKEREERFVGVNREESVRKVCLFCQSNRRTMKKKRELAFYGSTRLFTLLRAAY